MKRPDPSKLKQLRALTKKISKQERSPNPRIGKRTSQTSVFTLERINALQKISRNPRSKNFSIANKVFSILKTARSGEYQMVANERGKNADHEKLFLITQKIIKSDIQGKKAILTTAENNLVERYSKLTSGPF